MSKSMKYYLPLILVLLVGIFGGLLLVAKKESLNMGIKEANPVGDPDVELTTVTVAGEQGKRYWLALNADGSSVGTSVTAGFGANSGIDPSAVSWRIDPSSTSKVSASLSGARSGVFSAIGTNSGGWLANTFRVYGSYNGKELSTSVTVYVYCRWEPGSRNDSSDKAYGPYSSRRSGRASHTGDSSCHAYEGETVENGVYYYARYYNRCCGNNPETPIATKACYVNSATNDYQYVEQSPGDGYVKDTTLNETTCKPSNVCFTNSAGTEFKWQATYPGTGWSIVTGKTEDTCKACFVNSATNDYQWTTQSPGSGYTKSTTITTEGSCKPSKVCFSNSTGTEFKWQEAYPGSGWSIVTGKNEDTCKTCFIDYTNYQATWATKAPSSAYTKYDTTKGDCKCGNVTINKRDSKTLTQITGATLNLTNYGTLTGKTNTITLCPGKTYKLTETTAPSNYIKWTGSENLTVSNGNVNKATVNVDNIPCPKVTIKKVDENNALLSGATLKLTNYGNITDNEKVITLCPNTYVLSETAAPAGYVLSTETVTITVGNDGAASQSTISFRNTPNKLQINKVSDDDEMIAGSVLGLYQNNELKYQCTSTQSGCIIEKIVPGEYVLKEISQTEGYLLSTKTYAVRVNNDGKISIDSGEYSGVATVKFVNQANELIIDKVNWSGTALAGSNLGLYQGDELK